MGDKIPEVCGCGSHLVQVELMPKDFVHYAAARCAECGAWIKWLPPPGNGGETFHKRYTNIHRNRVTYHHGGFSMTGWKNKPEDRP